MAIKQKTILERADDAQQGGSVRPARIHFRTLTGSLYEIDYDAGIWRRLTRTTRSGNLRFEGGELLAHMPLQLGLSAHILFMSFDEDDVRVLTTSPVVSIGPATGSIEIN